MDNESRDIRDKVVEAVEVIGGEDIEGVITYNQIKGYIKKKWPNVNKRSIEVEFQTLSVNHNSRIHHGVNHKPRLTNSGSKYDYLYTLESGVVTKYKPEIHGIWEIYGSNGNRRIRQFSPGLSDKVFSPADIMWFKNVSNQEGEDAYLSLDSNVFWLHFPTGHKTNVLTPEINDIILLRQKINDVPCFTHLVTPMDNKLTLVDNKIYR